MDRDIFPQLTDDQKRNARTRTLDADRAKTMRDKVTRYVCTFGCARENLDSRRRTVIVAYRSRANPKHEQAIARAGKAGHGKH